MNEVVWRLVKGGSRSLVDLRSGGSRTPLYCIHGAGGDLNGYMELSTKLHSEIPVYGVQATYKGKTAGGHVQLLADEYFELIRKRSGVDAVCLMGYSAGAVIALLMAERLHRNGVAVKLLIALDGAPCNTGFELPATHPIVIGRKILNIAGWLQWYLKSRRDRQYVPKSAFVAALHNDLIDLASLNQIIANDREDRLTSFVQNLIASIEDLQSTHNYKGKVLSLQAKVQPLIRNRQIGKIWSSLAAADVVEFPGHHSSFAKGEKDTIDKIAEAINFSYDHLDL